MGSGNTAQAIADQVRETETVRLACDGDSRAFERLYNLYCRRVYGLCYRLAGNELEAEDLTQEAFFQVFRKIRTFRGESSFSTWLYRLTFNIVMGRFRKKRIPEVSLSSIPKPGQESSSGPMERGAPDPLLRGALDHMTLRKAIDQLPRGYREIFILHDVEGYTHGEIAEISGCSVGNSKSQLFRARLGLRQLLHEELRNRARKE